VVLEKTVKIRRRVKVKNEVKRIAFGPVPSRRLGQSLGINDYNEWIA